MKQLETKWGVSAAAPVAAAAPAGGGAAAAPVEEKTAFDVILKETGTNKIGVIKEVRASVAGLGLAEAKALVEGARRSSRKASPKPKPKRSRKRSKRPAPRSRSSSSHLCVLTPSFHHAPGLPGGVVRFYSTAHERRAPQCKLDQSGGVPGRRTAQRVRHEYLDGEVYAMSGASTQHTRITDDLLTALNSHLRGHRCEAFSHDMKVSIVEADRQWYYYPDVVVCCDPAGLSDYACRTPAIISKFLLPTRRGPTAGKSCSPTAPCHPAQYILVAQKHRELTVYRKNEAGLWTTEILPRDGGILHLPQLAFSVTLDDIYRRTGF